MGYEERPWLARYRPEGPRDIEPEFANLTDLFAAAVRTAPERPAIRYFDATITYGELGTMSDAFAVALAERGFAPGDRLALYLQNVPQAVIAALGTWKAGGIVVSVNPMSKARELRELLTDSGATALVAHESLYAEHAAAVVAESSVTTAITTSELDFQTRDDPRVFAGIERARPAGAGAGSPAPPTEDLRELLDAYAGRHPAPYAAAPGDPAFLTYTSGTTGPPKGAMNTHGNVVFNAQVYRDWIALGENDVILGVAPLFHITGIVGHTALALLLAAPLVLAYRFEPSVMLDAIREHRPTFTVGAITAYIALMNAPGATLDDFRTLTKLYSGGAPIPPSTVRAFEDKFGSYVHNIYGLTETTSPIHGVPLGSRAPVDEMSGALSIGVPVCNTVARIIGEDGRELPPGEVGEIVARGPQIVPGYWNKPEETANALGGGELRTGDVGYMDAAGWFYIIDRKKDQINAGGYKVWPREVEDVLYEHPSVREAAVVGVPDEYRGETVKAFVSLRPGTAGDPDELIAFCRERMAAYKYPRAVVVMDELPKTVTGKLLRRALRDGS